MANLNGLRVRVLVVDDYPDSADVLAVLLSQHGADARPVYDAATVVTHAAIFDPTLVILDLGLEAGTSDGAAACRLLRRAKGPAVHIVALTGWLQADDVRRMAEAGFDGHFAKPVDSQVLLNYVATLAPPPPGR